MASYAWFDISTSNNKGLADAKQNDVLIRCIHSNQRFLVGVTGQTSSFIVNTDGTAKLASNLDCPYVMTRCIRPIDNIIQMADGVFIYECNVLSTRVTTSNMSCSNLIVAPDGIIHAGKSVTIIERLTCPTIFTNQISRNSGDNIIFTDPVVMEQSLTLCNLVSSNVTVGKHVSTYTLDASHSMSTPLAMIQVLSNVDTIKIQGLVAENSNLAGSNLAFKTSTIASSTFSNVYTSNLWTIHTNTSLISALSNNTIDLENTRISRGNFSCSAINASNNLVVLGESTLAKKVTISSNLDVANIAEFKSNVHVTNDMDCSNLVSRSRITCQDLITNNISPPNDNLYISGDKFKIIDGCNLYTTNATFQSQTSSKITCDTCTVNDTLKVKNTITTESLVVNTTADVTSNITCPTLHTTTIVGINNTSVGINNILIDRSNISLAGYANMSNVFVKHSVVLDTFASMSIKCPSVQMGLFTLSNDMMCSQDVTAQRVIATHIKSSNNELNIDNFVIRDLDHLHGHHVNINELKVNTKATIQSLDVATDVRVSNNIQCKSNVFCDMIKGYTTPGNINIESINITDNNKLTAHTLFASNVTVTNGELILQDNAVIRKQNGPVIIDIHGKLHGSNVIANESINSACLKNGVITSDKLGTNAITSAHLSSGLSFTGTCRFDDIDLRGSFKADGTMNICGVSFSNACIGLGGITVPDYQLHIKGKSMFSDSTVNVFTGLSNNTGVVAIQSTHVQSPVGIILSQDTPTQHIDSKIQLATYPACFGIGSTQPGDLVIQTKDVDGRASKVYVNESIVVSASNIGIWKSEPLAPLHTSIFAADKVGLGGRTSPNDTLDMIGNITVMRDTNAGSVSLKLLDVDETGANMWLDMTKKLGIYNQGGDISISAHDNDPSTCEHIRIQSITGNIGLGTSSPLAPLHIHNRLRPGATPSANTVHINTDTAAVLFETNAGSHRFELSSNGVVTTNQSTIKPYIKLLGTHQVYHSSVSDFSMLSGNDLTMELGNFTRIILFTQPTYLGTFELIENPHPSPLVVPLTGPQRKLNWSSALRSFALSSMNTTCHRIASDIRYIENMTNSDVFYMNSTMKLIGLGTPNPQAALDIHSSLTSNVIAYKSIPILDTQLNLRNIQELSITGPFSVNGHRILDTDNNLIGINSVNFDTTLVKDNKVIIDDVFNMSNIQSVSIKGPLYYNGQPIIDADTNILNVNTVSARGPMTVNGRKFVDADLNTTCMTLSASGTVSSDSRFELDTVGSIERRGDDMMIMPAHACAFVNVGNTLKTATIHPNRQEFELHGTLSHQGYELITNTRSMSNIQNITMAGDLAVGPRTVIANTGNITTTSLNVTKSITHNDMIIVDQNRDVMNIGSVSMGAPFVINAKTIIDDTLNLQNIKRASVESLTLNGSSSMTNTTDGVLTMECSGFKLTLKDAVGTKRVMLNCVQTGTLYCDAHLQAMSIKTTVIDADDQGADLDIKTQPGYFAKTNVGFSGPKYKIGDQGYAMQADPATNALHVLGPGNIKLLDVQSTHTYFKNKIIIGQPQETEHELSVAGSIFCDRDMYSFSDERKKINIRRIPDALKKLRKLKGVVFNRIEDPSRTHTGVIAQDVQRVLPEAVFEDPYSGYLSVAYGNLVGLLIESIKDIYTLSKTTRRTTQRVRLRKIKGCVSIVKTKDT